MNNKRNLIILILLIVVSALVLFGNFKGGIYSDEYSDVVSFIDKERNIANEIEFDYNIKSNKTVEYNLGESSKNILNLDVELEENTTSIEFEVLSIYDNSLYKNTLLGNLSNEIHLKEKPSKVKITFNSGCGKGVIKWNIR